MNEMEMLLFLEENNIKLADGIDEGKSITRQLLEHTRELTFETSESLRLESCAEHYNQRGIIAQERLRFDVAEEWYRKALEIYERLRLERYIADEYHQLGIIAQERQRFEEAEGWYKKALEIYEKLGLERYVAKIYHQLGMIAQGRRQFDKAEDWYRKALEIKESRGLERYIADEYHQLGMIAQERQQFEKAEDWYKKAFEIKEKLRHPPLKVNTLAQFGVLRRQQKRYKDSVAWFAKAHEIATSYQMQVATAILLYIDKLREEMGKANFESVWQEVTANQTQSFSQGRILNTPVGLHNGRDKGDDEKTFQEEIRARRHSKQ